MHAKPISGPLMRCVREIGALADQCQRTSARGILTPFVPQRVMRRVRTRGMRDTGGPGPDIETPRGRGLTASRASGTTSAPMNRHGKKSGCASAPLWAVDHRIVRGPAGSGGGPRQVGTPHRGTFRPRQRVWTDVGGPSNANAARSGGGISFPALRGPSRRRAR